MRGSHETSDVEQKKIREIGHKALAKYLSASQRESWGEQNLELAAGILGCHGNIEKQHPLTVPNLVGAMRRLWRLQRLGVFDLIPRDWNLEERAVLMTALFETSVLRPGAKHTSEVLDEERDREEIMRRMHATVTRITGLREANLAFEAIGFSAPIGSINLWWPMEQDRALLLHDHGIPREVILRVQREGMLQAREVDFKMFSKVELHNIVALFMKKPKPPFYETKGFFSLIIQAKGLGLLQHTEGWGYHDLWTAVQPSLGRSELGSDRVAFTLGLQRDGLLKRPIINWTPQGIERARRLKRVGFSDHLLMEFHRSGVLGLREDWTDYDPTKRPPAFLVNHYQSGNPVFYTVTHDFHGPKKMKEIVRELDQWGLFKLAQQWEHESGQLYFADIEREKAIRLRKRGIDVDIVGELHDQGIISVAAYCNWSDEICRNAIALRKRGVTAAAIDTIGRAGIEHGSMLDFNIIEQATVSDYVIAARLTRHFVTGYGKYQLSDKGMSVASHIKDLFETDLLHVVERAEWDNALLQRDAVTLAKKKVPLKIIEELRQNGWLYHVADLDCTREEAMAAFSLLKRLLPSREGRGYSRVFVRDDLRRLHSTGVLKFAGDWDLEELIDVKYLIHKQGIVSPQDIALLSGIGLLHFARCLRRDEELKSVLSLLREGVNPQEIRRFYQVEFRPEDVEQDRFETDYFSRSARILLEFIGDFSITEVAAAIDGLDNGITPDQLFVLRKHGLLQISRGWSPSIADSALNLVADPSNTKLELPTLDMDTLQPKGIDGDKVTVLCDLTRLASSVSKRYASYIEFLRRELGNQVLLTFKPQHLEQLRPVFSNASLQSAFCAAQPTVRTFIESYKEERTPRFEIGW